MPGFVARLLISVAIVGAAMWVQPRINHPAVTVSDGLNLRSAPDVRAQRVAVLPPGSTVQVQRCLADMQWCRVHSGEQRGWVAAGYLHASIDGQARSVDKAGKALGLSIEPGRRGG